jgi:lipopolysaccharide/colanic/teichoic acid biosynthesis glycosyltransferase
MGIQMETTTHTAVVIVNRPWASAVSGFLYRLLEKAVAAAILILTLPVTAVIAIIIKMGTPGRVLFLQERIGKDGKPFQFVKFRTMYADARERFPELYSYSFDEECIKTFIFKIKDDPRLTPQGRWLRKTSLDELPNFWNVLTGDMALIGPRPEIPEMVRYYPLRLRDKFLVRPGITGLAQISGRGNLSFLDTANLDVLYVHERSWKLDLKIFFKSVKCVVLAIGAF